PTTLLAQVDSSVGGKTGVNHERGKNLIGAFYQPKFVYIDIDTLKTLDVREIRAGLAEVIKYGVIEDEGLFEYIEDNVQSILSLNEENLKHIIKRSCEIKAKVVEDDELESGYRANLNFGHTFGHAVEALTEYKEYKHGEAVAIGMVASAKMSNKLGLCEERVFQRIQNLISKAGLPWKLPAFDNNDYLNAIKIDKKVIGDMLRFVLTDRIGHVDIKEISEEECTSLLEGLKN
ncbi:MAG: 3-dehydroquinate synthase, partial [Candidatus Heimdallarchaeota archaeon]|nr:3-dehydroquinate synthase [Candidatus Heimdallarchaeota archaeon]